MELNGVIEAFGRETINGWAAVSENGKFCRPDITVRFKSYGTFGPAELFDLEDGRTGFLFRLPEPVRNLPWKQFLDEFEAVIARDSTSSGATEFRLPFYKSSFVPFDVDNRTTIKASRLKEYSLAPIPNGRIAAFTIAYNEHLILPLWAQYYAKHFGAENLYVIDQGSAGPPYRKILPDGVNIITVPRDVFDNWLIERLVATLQRFLLESYDSVLYTDSDEFVCLDPEIASGASLKEFLTGLREPIGITTGFDLLHELESEGSYDPTRPILSQRRFMHRMPMMDKPVISRLPLNWVPGFHTAAEGGARIPGLYLLHLRWFDLGFALHKGGIYRESAWSSFDLQARLAAYQREEANAIESRFQSLAAQVRASKCTQFEIDTKFTIVPEWMKAAIPI
jgi:hypothetical protein